MTGEPSKEERRRTSILDWYDRGVGLHRDECRWDEDDEEGSDCTCGSSYLGAMQAVRSGAMRHLVDDYKDDLPQAELERDEARAEAARYKEVLKKIKDTEGHVCDTYDLPCQHVGCDSSYSSWAIADAALAVVQEPPGVAPEPAQERGAGE